MQKSAQIGDLMKEKLEITSQLEHETAKLNELEEKIAQTNAEKSDGQSILEKKLEETTKNLDEKAKEIAMLTEALEKVGFR